MALEYSPEWLVRERRVWMDPRGLFDPNGYGLEAYPDWMPSFHPCAPVEWSEYDIATRMHYWGPTWWSPPSGDYIAYTTSGTAGYF